MQATNRPHEPKRLYVLTRLDLSPAQAIVQTAHALAELMLEFAADP